MSFRANALEQRKEGEMEVDEVNGDVAAASNGESGADCACGVEDREGDSAPMRSREGP